MPRRTPALPFPAQLDSPASLSVTATERVEIDNVGASVQIRYRDADGYVPWSMVFDPSRVPHETVLWLRKMMERMGPEFAKKPSRRPLLGPRLLP